jgi:hypothetical protein
MGLEQIMTILGLSELQFALLAIGIVIMMIVLMVNMRSTRVHQNTSNGSGVSTSGFATTNSSERTEPSFGMPLPQTIALNTRASNFAIDPRIDCVITLRFDQAISGQEILSEIHAWQELKLPTAAHSSYEGLNADIDSAEDWEAIRMEASYAELQLAIQLASRRGSIGVLELSDFCSRAQVLAETLGAQIDMPSVNTMLESAQELDAMAAENDIQLSINVQLDKPLPWINFDNLLRQQGFKLARNGSVYDFFSGDHLLFNSAELKPNQPVSQLSLLLEVPLVAQELQGFERMLSAGAEIAQAAQGRMVDDNGINLTESAVASIRQHLDVIYTTLEKSGVPAGSAAAHRLFS